MRQRALFCSVGPSSAGLACDGRRRGDAARIIATKPAHRCALRSGARAVGSASYATFVQMKLNVFTCRLTKLFTTV